MRAFLSIPSLVFLAALAAAPAARAFETDQFTTPPAPLTDIGPDIDAKVHQTLQDIVKQVNAEIDELQRRQNRTKSPHLHERLQFRMDALLAEKVVAERLYDELGKDGIESDIEAWIRYRDWPGDNAVHEQPIVSSSLGIPYGHPLIMVGLAPTINNHGVYHGTDKIGHLFNHGYDYYATYLRLEKRNLPRDQILARAVRIGVNEETGLYGELLSGIYSNADLAANYAGMLFYLNITRPVSLDDRTIPPILTQHNNRWRFNTAYTQRPLQPFISHHFDESRNPCDYGPLLRSQIRDGMRDCAEDWMKHHQTTPRLERKRYDDMATYFGHAYGYRGPDDIYTIADAYADRKAALLAASP